MYSNHSAQDSNSRKKGSSTSSFFKPQQSSDEDKKELIEKIAREVCDQIYQERYYFYTNPPGTTVLMPELKPKPDFFSFSEPISFSYPENYDQPLAIQKIGLLRTYIDGAFKALWVQYSNAFPILLNRYNLSEEMRSLATTYFKDLGKLCYLRICSAYFEVFKGGNCNEISAHVTYKMLGAFDRLNLKEIPSIRQLRLLSPANKNMNHAICVINLEQHSVGDSFFNKDISTGFICDPWFYQYSPFTAMKDVETHLMLSPNVNNYIVVGLYEIGRTLDISSLDPELQDDLQNFRKMLIKEPYKVPEEEQETLRKVAQNGASKEKEKELLEVAQEEPQRPRPK